MFNEIDETTTAILESLSHIKNWVQNQSYYREHTDFDDEDIVISLSSKNPQQIEKIVQYDYNNRQFVSKKLNEQTIVHLDIPSIIVSVDSEEGKQQLERNRIKEELANRRSSQTNLEGQGDEEEAEDVKKKKRRKRTKKRNNNEGHAVKSKPKEQKYLEARESNVESVNKKPQNQFKNQERATQTSNKCQKSIEVQTEPPKKINFSALVNQWKIYDRYQAYEAAKENADREEEQRLGEKKPRKRLLVETPTPESLRELEERKMLRCGRILERMVNQNNYNDIAIGKT